MSDSLIVDEVITETDVIRVSWYNPEKTIAILEIKKQWNWEDAYPSVAKLNEIVMSQPHPVYTIYYYRMAKAPLFPKGVNLPNLRKLVEFDPPNEQLVIFVRSDRLLYNLIMILSKTYGLRHIFQKYRFLNTWSDALAEIQKHQASQLSL
ncbi:MAG: hypothetical protein MUE54_02535 [Anaerolineae bacterium]|jgi:hypothetical protein|nr:hypothetical protein [Anaerolineae bacterium]